MYERSQAKHQVGGARIEKDEQKVTLERADNNQGTYQFVWVPEYHWLHRESRDESTFETQERRKTVRE